MRIKGLDFFRGIAIILVLARHGFHDTVLQHIGWAGVDLFFVLSGFLVSGLIFREYLSTGRIDAKKFLMRRVLKVVPPFYAFILVCVVFKYFLKHEHYESKMLLSEIFYLQSCLPNVWLHTWSLAAEVHFYIAFLLLSIWIIRSKKIDQKKLMIGLFILTYLIFFTLRLNYSYQQREKEFFVFTQTHLRLDGLLLGTLLAYLYHFTNVLRWFMENKKTTVALSGVLLAPLFIFEGGGLFMNTVGISSMNIGFAMLIILVVQPNYLMSLLGIKIANVFFETICFIGVCSYSIYIWHLIALRVTDSLLFSYLAVSITVYLILAIVIGAFFYIIIEWPISNYKKRVSGAIHYEQH